MVESKVDDESLIEIALRILAARSHRVMVTAHAIEERCTCALRKFIPLGLRHSVGHVGAGSR